jgi:cyclic-di-GMP phosphodiesterase TipF (flagellum assembly factor)
MSHNQGLAEYLIFEFVERDASDYSPDVRRNLDELAALGFQFSMDKVSSLNLDIPGLAARHFKFAKIDSTILLGTGGSGASTVNAGSLKQMMARYGMDLIAAKIETETVLVDLLDFDVDYGQGYLFGEPRPGREGARHLA